jgi:hypothetical protein
LGIADRGINILVDACGIAASLFFIGRDPEIGLQQKNNKNDWKPN